MSMEFSKFAKYMSGIPQLDNDSYSQNGGYSHDLKNFAEQQQLTALKRELTHYFQNLVDGNLIADSRMVQQRVASEVDYIVRQRAYNHQVTNITTPEDVQNHRIRFDIKVQMTPQSGIIDLDLSKACEGVFEISEEFKFAFDTLHEKFSSGNIDYESLGEFQKHYGRTIPTASETSYPGVSQSQTTFTYGIDESRYMNDVDGELTHILKNNDYRNFNEKRRR